MMIKFRCPAAALLALLCVGLTPRSSVRVLVDAASLATCIQQAPCLKFSAQKLSSTTCSGISTCPVQICMKFELNATGCNKDSSQTVSDACDNSDSQGCVRPMAWNLTSVKGSSVDDDMNTVCPTDSTYSDLRCNRIPNGYSMCQIGKPGDTLYFTVKDGSDTGADVQTFTQTVKDGCGSGVDVLLNLNCASAPSVQKCCTPACTGNGAMERTWSVQVPDLCSCSPPVPPPTPSPVGQPTTRPPTQAPAPGFCETQCVYTGEDQCGYYTCDEERECCHKYIFAGTSCTKSDPTYNDNCFLGKFCDSNGICQYSYTPANGTCTLTAEQLAAGGYTQPGCLPTGTCQPVSGTSWATQCVPVPGTAVTKVTSFTLVDSQAPNTTYELETFTNSLTMNYKTLGRCDYNIRVNTQDCGSSHVDSVKIEWDLDVPRKGQNYGNLTLCEQYTPYAVFGDTQFGTPKDLGPYSPLFGDATLFLGTHHLKATPYSGSNCNGTAGTPLSATVLVTWNGETDCPGTVANIEIYNKVTKSVTKSLLDYDNTAYGDETTYCFPTNYTLRACAAPCRDGEIKWMLWQLYYLDPMYGSTLTYSYNDTTKPNFAWDELTPSPTLADGMYVLVVTPYGNIYNNSVTPPKVISSYGKGTPQTYRFTINCGMVG